MEMAKQEIELIENSIKPIIKQADILVVETEDDVDTASQFLRKIKDAEIILEDKRKEFTAPLNTSLKAINSTFKEMKEPLILARDSIQVKILSWRKEEQRKKDEEAKRLAEIVSKEKEEGNLEEIEPVKLEPEKIKTNIGNTQVRKYWNFKVFNVEDIPREYLQLNETKVRTAIRNGVREIPGLEIFQEEKISIV
jgi:hypothetical protein